ncbi:MAG: hypothetical protein N2490_00495 [Ignavibacteria bacterium]|nr:hypothetical protein [Ignavibacteria bacterium]
MEGLKEIFRTYDPMEANLAKAKLMDEDIWFEITGDSQLTITMETFNTPLTRMALKQPIIIYVKPDDEERAKNALFTDRSNLLNEDYDY